MGEITKWERFIEWFEFELLRRIGLISLKTYRQTSEFYLDWLIEISEKQDISLEEKENILVVNEPLYDPDNHFVEVSIIFSVASVEDDTKLLGTGLN